MFMKMSTQEVVFNIHTQLTNIHTQMTNIHNKYTQYLRDFI